MNENEWLACRDPNLMLTFLQGRISDRKLRLFGVACCRKRESLMLKVKGAWRAVIIAERAVERLPVEEDINEFRCRLGNEAFGWIDSYQQERENNIMNNVGRAAENLLDGLGTAPIRPELSPSMPELMPNLSEMLAVFGRTRDAYLERCADRMAFAVAHQLRRNDLQPMNPQHYRAELAEQVPLLRDIIGNPFCPVFADASWLTSTVAALAQAIYADRAFDRLPILADALEEVGCDNADVLAHGRGDGPHDRGCWVVDLIMGKE